MGVPQIWELLRPHIKDRRVPLRKFAADYKKRTGSPLRVAIDGYTWIFECGFLTNQDVSEKYAGYGKISKAVVNFVHRLKEFLSLDIYFILVFDGNMKPWFKNKLTDGDILSSENTKTIADYQAMWRDHLWAHEQLGTCLKSASNEHSSDFIKVIKHILETMKISYIEACGEGEAQCAWLQKHGYVDYVLSNDSDTLIFGCDKILRNYSRSPEDFGVTGIGDHRPEVARDTKESFITVVELEHLRKSTGERYEWWSLLFFSVLLGADYNQGVKGLGKSKSSKLAQLTDPDFAMEFRQIFECTGSSSTESSKTVEYEAFQKRLLMYCARNSVELFGRNYSKLLSKDNMEGWPSEIAIMFYFHPYVLPSVNTKKFDQVNINFSENNCFHDINFEKLRAYLSGINLSGVLHFDRWFLGSMQESFLLRHLLHNEREIKDEIKITEEKTFMSDNHRFQYSCWRVRFNDFIDSLVNMESVNITPLSRQVSPIRRHAMYKYNVWIPKELIPESNCLVQRFRKEQKLLTKPSPKKRSKYSPQKNTLDSFLSQHSSLVKETTGLSASDIPLLGSVKRRLFVEEVLGSDDPEDEEDSSLIILSETTISPKESNSTLVDLEINAGDGQNKTTNNGESPLKKQRATTKRQM